MYVYMCIYKHVHNIEADYNHAVYAYLPIYNMYT